MKIFLHLVFFFSSLVCLSLGLACVTSSPVRCRHNVSCVYGVERCAKNSETSIRGGVYCTTLVNSLEEMFIEQMGCMYDQETSKSCLNQSECRMKFTNQDETFLHCCCNQDSCNVNLDISNPWFIRSLNDSTDSEESAGRWCSAWFCPRRRGWMSSSSSSLFVVACLLLVVVLLSLLLCFSLRRSVGGDADDHHHHHRRRRRRRPSKSLFKWICHSMEKPLKSVSLEVEGGKNEEFGVSAKMFPENNEEEENEENKPKEIDRECLVIDRSALIRRGRFGEICLGRYRGEKVALKILMNSLTLESVHLLFEREKSIYCLPFFCHPNLLRLIGSLIVDRSECLVLQYASAGSLKEFLRAHRIDGEEQLIHLTRQIGNALEYLHQDCSSSSSSLKGRGVRHPIAHRDLKSENILLSDGGRVLLADFAMSVEVDPNHLSSRDHHQLGTPRYMPPEILAGTIGNEWDALLKCDLYAFALVAWEILSRVNTLESSVEYFMPYEEQLLQRNFNRNPSVAEMLQIIHLPVPFNRPIIRPAWKSQSNTIQLFIQTIEQAWDQLPEARINAALVAHRMRQL